MRGGKPPVNHGMADLTPWAMYWIDSLGVKGRNGNDATNLLT